MPAGAAKAVDYAFGEPSLAPSPAPETMTYTYTYDGNLNAGDPSAPLPSGLSLGVEDRTVSLSNRTTEQTFYPAMAGLVNGGAVGQRGAAGSRSELFSAYSTTLDADRSALPATDHALMLGQTDLEYEVTRVKSPVLGRDLNPMGRGDGTYYANGGNIMGGSVRIGSAKTRWVGQLTFGYGNSMNNQGLGPGDGDEKLGERARRAQDECGALLIACVCMLYKCGGDPCADLDTDDPHEFCCVCLPRVAPPCGEDCDDPEVCGCLEAGPGWHEKCGNPATGDGPPVLPPPGQGRNGRRLRRLPIPPGRFAGLPIHIWPGIPFTPNVAWLCLCVGLPSGVLSSVLLGRLMIFRPPQMLPWPFPLPWQRYPDWLLRWLMVWWSTIPWPELISGVITVIQMITGYFRRTIGIPGKARTSLPELPPACLKGADCRKWCDERYAGNVTLQDICKNYCAERDWGLVD